MAETQELTGVGTDDRYLGRTGRPVMGDEYVARDRSSGSFGLSPSSGGDLMGEPRIVECVAGRGYDLALSDFLFLQAPPLVPWRRN